MRPVPCQTGSRTSRVGDRRGRQGKRQSGTSDDFALGAWQRFTLSHTSTCARHRLTGPQSCERKPCVLSSERRRARTLGAAHAVGRAPQVSRYVREARRAGAMFVTTPSCSTARAARRLAGSPKDRAVTKPSSGCPLLALALLPTEEQEPKLLHGSTYRLAGTPRSVVELDQTRVLENFGPMSFEVVPRRASCSRHRTLVRPSPSEGRPRRSRQPLPIKCGRRRPKRWPRSLRFPMDAMSRKRCGTCVSAGLRVLGV